MKKQETKKNEKVVKNISITVFFSTIIGILTILTFFISHYYKQGIGHGSAELSIERSLLKTKTEAYNTLQEKCTKLEARIALLEDSIQSFKDREKKTNDANIANSTFKKQIEDLMKQGNNLLINYKEQTDMTYKFNTWKSKVIGILNNKDKDIAKKTDNIASKYSPSDYYSQIKDIINLLNNHLN
jgi:uncharacterized small protein (DUF1192 family)